MSTTFKQEEIVPLVDTDVCRMCTEHGTIVAINF